VLAVIVAIALYAYAQSDDAIAGVFKPAAFGVAFFSLVLAGRTFGTIVRFPLQILMLMGCWLLFVEMFFTGNMGVAAAFLSLMLCIAATASYYHSSFSKGEKRVIYGVIVFAVALPSSVSLIQPRVFESIFGIGSARPMVIASVVAMALYVSALIAWLPHPKREE